ncbi:hypothetical protein I2F27_10145 [Acinetobacter sp. B5B]|uniref:transposase n=1 Tax=Acinetobacter baretiae TaxID=2605383 RepID=UPI002E2E673B|nr:transposase [Acinetobacter baretiae]MBF7683676.1 hypothetical protein [Acinetobacter baretiae]
MHALHFTLMKDKKNSYLWIDSITLPVCKNQRIQHHKSRSDIATRGRSPVGWFFSCKLHVLMNVTCEMVNTLLSNEHVADIKMIEQLVTGQDYILNSCRSRLSQSRL